MPTALYEDRWITCEPDRLIIRGYYFPTGNAKVIAYPQIRGVARRSLTTWGGRWRLWGGGDLRHWWHFDPDRPRKQTALVLDLGRWVRPVITPDDPAAVVGIIEQRRRPSH